MVYVISKDGQPLMPTNRYGKVRHLLKNKQAKVVSRKPFTIKLNYDSKTYTQPVTLGVDTGYQTIGVSAVGNEKELFSCEVNLLKNISERIKEKAQYRKIRRSRKRYRKPKFDNRTRPEGWFTPSVLHKFNSHVKIIEKITNFLPVKKVVIETANFDIQKINNPEINGREYQNGVQKDFWNIREYVLHRDNHTCQYCKKKDVILEVHHIGFWKNDRSNRPGNLITLCTKCHLPVNHTENGFLYGWTPKIKSFRPETFMSMVRWKIYNRLQKAGYDICHTFGYITKSIRISLGIDKSHANDAFVIAGGQREIRSIPYIYEQVRRNNRSLEKFYDAKYIDIRDGKKKSGQELFCGRRTRNKNFNTENLRNYRGEKVCKGRRNIRRNKYLLQPGDLVKFMNRVMQVAGMQNKGAYVRLKELSKPVSIQKVIPYKFMRGMCTI